MRRLCSAWMLAAGLLLAAGCESGHVTGPGTTTPQDQAPIAKAGNDFSVQAGSTVTLDGSASSDPDGDALTYFWKQLEGGAVTLSDPRAQAPTFLAPTVASASTLVFQLTVSDGKLTAVAVVAVTVNPIAAGNQPPVAQASAPSAVQPGMTVTLDGSGSSDPDGDSLLFSWQQLSGPSVTLSGANSAVATFTAPTVSADTPLSFRLHVADPHDASSTADVTVTVKVPVAGNNPPVANAGADVSATASTLVTLNGSGSSDPDGDAITYQWIQTAGPTVTLSNPSAQKPTFTAPTVTGSTVLTFSLTVTDSKGAASAADTVNVTVTPQITTTATFTKVVSLHAVTRHGIVVFFLTDVAVKATVSYGVASTSEAQVTESTATTRHVITLSGLTANTQYKYAVSAGTATASGSFWTAIDGSAGNTPFRFAVAGDARGHTEWANVSNAILAKAPRFLIQTGDNNDDAGSAVNWADYYKSGQAMFAKIPVFAAQGNHDTGSNYSVYNVAPQSSSGSDLYYAFVYGNVGFVAINTNSASSSTQNTWIQGALGKLTGGPLFAFHHHPLYSCGAHGSSSTMQGYYKTMFENSHLTVDFTGHDHDLIAWSTINSVRYVVSGGGGTTLYSLSGCQGPFAKQAYGFTIVDIDGANVVESFYDDAGTQLYTTSFTAYGSAPNYSGLGNLVVL